VTSKLTRRGGAPERRRAADVALSPLKQLAPIAASRMVLQEIDRLAAGRLDFASETTLSGLSYAQRLRAWKRSGYLVEVVYLRLRSTQLALRRIAARVRQGAMTCSGVTLFEDSQGAGRILSEYIGLGLIAWVRTTIPGVHRGS
jgi:hypothetical protein